MIAVFSDTYYNIYRLLRVCQYVYDIKKWHGMLPYFDLIGTSIVETVKI